MRLTILSVGLAMVASPVLAQGNPQAGQRLAEATCARCHAVGRAGDSPLRIAPPFRTLHTRYPVENLAEALAEASWSATRPCPSSASTRTRSIT